MHAIYLRTPCLRAVENALNAGEKKLTSFFHDVRVHTVEEEIISMYDPEGLSFYNINTPQDLQMAEGIHQNLRNHEKD
jgi:molybdopterin-guanine dinucleotide biosynthesis protein A